MVVQGHIALQGLLHVIAAVESMGLEHVRDAPVEALHHAIGSGRPGLWQPVLDAQLLAQLVELVLATRFALLAGEQAVLELLAVVGQQLLDPDRTGLVSAFRKASALTAVLWILHCTNTHRVARSMATTS